MNNLIASIISLLIVQSLCSSIGLADVDAREGSFSQSWQDDIGPKEDNSGSIEREYRSRSHYRGVFGFRWCSPDLDRMFASMIRRAPVQSPSTCSTKSLQSKAPTLQLRRVGNDWISSDPQGRQVRWRFNESKGLLLEVRREDGQGWSYQYQNELLVAVKPLLNKDLQDAQRVSIQHYKYDLSRNLVAYHLGETSVYQIAYDLAYDRVTELTDHLGCTDTFQYESSSGKHGIKIQSTSYRRLCAGKLVAQKTYVFEEQMNPELSQLRLQRLRIVDMLSSKKETMTYD
jgi:hypothetical protein